MPIATALPMKGAACCNPRMLQREELAAAIRTALDLKAEATGLKLGPSALGRALGITQPSASELLKTGRLAKEKLSVLLEFFADVVGPDHFGLPFSKAEMELIKDLRRLPTLAQDRLRQQVRDAAQAAEAAAAAAMAPAGSHGKHLSQRAG